MRRRWDRHAIKAAVHRKGLTLVGIARKAGLEESACKVALRRRNWRGEAAIAEALGLHPSALWPDRYRSSAPIYRRNRNHVRACVASPNDVEPLAGGAAR
ncbi:putative transcriptional regulator, Nlp [Rhodopseudomonas palustris TIE-1]|uniref:helix-turn-helix domain-containing protein n=1 Tax=Rhodopseudomonas palustris TaxID=1076 RepID=UPI00017795C7|nr:helix-turn-helix domain-containing protein [Rhodopseudomonas palustris]ACE99201.1 putative transcriptional regulator, Nlp [Rhodopseudomonas palustris TIE-1]